MNNIAKPNCNISATNSQFNFSFNDQNEASFVDGGSKLIVPMTESESLVNQNIATKKRLGTKDDSFIKQNSPRHTKKEELKVSVASAEQSLMLHNKQKMSLIEQQAESPVHFEQRSNSPISVDASSVSLGRTLPLVVYNNRLRKFEINAQTAGMIENNKNPLAMLAITGPQNTGKSFLLSHIFVVPKAFDDSALKYEKQNVINIFSEPLGLDKNNKTFDVYLLDCEGFGKKKEDPEYDMKLFSIAILMSSFLIFNQNGPITNQSMEKLSFTSKILKNINDKKQILDFPELLWLLRDINKEDKQNPPTKQMEQSLFWASSIK